MSRHRVAASLVLALVVLVAAACYPPTGIIDSALAVTPTPRGVRVVGWAYDPDTTNSISVHVYVDGVPVGSIGANLARSDVHTAFPDAPLNSGFDGTFTTAPGSHNVCVYAIDSTGEDANTQIGCRTVVVPGGSPNGVWDTALGTTSPDGVRVAGWAFDPDTASPVTIHVYVDNVLTTTTANGARSDVQSAIPGAPANTGFNVTIPTSVGNHSVCVYALDAAGGDNNASLGCRTFLGGRRGNSNSYAYMMVNPDEVTPVRWNPCAVIHYQVNTQNIYPTALADIQAALADVSAASGITFQYDGTTSTLPSQTYGETGYPGSYAPLLIGLVHTTQSNLLPQSGDPDYHQVLAVGGARPAYIGNGKFAFVTGMVAVDVDVMAIDGELPGNGNKSYQTVLKHELSHVLGLAHVLDTDQLMYPAILGLWNNFGAGDLTGLAKQGTASGCLSPATVGGANAATTIGKPGPLVLER